MWPSKKKEIVKFSRYFPSYSKTTTKITKWYQERCYGLTGRNRIKVYLLAQTHRSKINKTWFVWLRTWQWFVKHRTTNAIRLLWSDSTQTRRINRIELNAISNNIIYTLEGRTFQTSSPITDTSSTSDFRVTVRRNYTTTKQRVQQTCTSSVSIYYWCCFALLLPPC